MANGIYIAMTGAIAAQRRLDSVAHNVANTDTPGFRQQRAQFSAFMIPPSDGRPAEKGFVAMTDHRIDETAGAIAQTGNPLDVAIDGPGWFVVGGPGEELLTRSGNFRMRPDGTLVDTGGNPVLGGSGGARSPIVLRPDGGQPSVGRDGTITQDGTEVARIAIVTADPAALTPRGDTHYGAPAQAIQDAPATGVIGGALESSNMNPVRGLVELVQLTRDFQSAQKVMSEYRRLDQKLLASG